MKPAEFNAIRDAQGLRVALNHAVTRYDRQEEAKPRRNHHNHYALAIYLGRVSEVADIVERGEATLAQALYDNFNDRLLTFVERAAGLEVTYGGGRADKGRLA